MTRADTSTPAPPGPPTPSPNPVQGCACTITSQTLVASPADRARTVIGVGEAVNLTVSPGPATWAIDRGSGPGVGGKLFAAGSADPLSSSASATTVRFVAGERPGGVAITAKASNCSCTIYFVIVAPSKWVMQREAGTVLEHGANRPDCGFLGRPYVQPDFVNFYAIEIREKDCLPEVTGSYAVFASRYHGDYPLPERVGAWKKADSHVPGLGTKFKMVDHIYSGDTWNNVGFNPPFKPGTMTYPITWEWRLIDVGAISSFPTTPQRHEVTAAGGCTSSKGEHMEETLYDEPQGDPLHR
jgi:hypothetical protein